MRLPRHQILFAFMSLTPFGRMTAVDLSAKQVTPRPPQSEGKILPIIISDLKLDDNLMILLTYLRKEFAPPHIIASGLHNLKKGATTTHDFLKQTLKKEPDVRFILSQPEDQAVDHEITFMEEDPKLVTTSLDSYLEEARKFSHDRVMIIQIAQMKSQNIDRLISTFESKISAYLLIALFNAFQGSCTATTDFLNSVQRKIQLHNPQSLFLYSDNVRSFSHEVGSQVLFKDMLPYIPLDHLKRAVRDPFQYTHIFGAAAVLRSENDDECSRMARALFILGTTPNFQVRGANQDRAPPVMLELLERVGKEYEGGNLIIALADGLEKLRREDKGDIFDDTSMNQKALGKANKEGMALIKEGEGDALRAVVTAGRIQATDTDRIFNQELIKFSTLSIAPLEAQKNSYLAIRMAGGVMKGFKEFTVEACDGLHGVIWFYEIFNGGSLFKNLQTIRKRENKLIVAATFEEDPVGERAVARTLTKEELDALSAQEKETSEEHETITDGALEVTGQDQPKIKLNSWLLVADKTDPKPMLIDNLKASIKEIHIYFELTELSPFFSAASDLPFSESLNRAKNHLDPFGGPAEGDQRVKGTESKGFPNDEDAHALDVGDAEHHVNYEDLMHVAESHF